MKDFHPDFLGETARRIGLKRYPNTRQFVVQHLYPDTLRLLLLLQDFVPIECVVGIGYSGNDAVVEALRSAGIRVVTPTFADLEDTVREELARCLDFCQTNKHRLVLHEVGGYAIKALHEHFAEACATVVGAIEVTKQGVWAAQALPRLRIPQVNCAQTRLKEIEGGMVGEAVVSSLDNILREMGFAMVGREALVYGYGWVGRGTANSLRQRGMRVSVNDLSLIHI
ncbi:MAG: hypothetical protein KUG77_11805 [Nannocystaceae bacterium]|nr:hypothetical protein [Nannocystaceae bacterium]